MVVGHHDRRAEGSWGQRQRRTDFQGNGTTSTSPEANAQDRAANPLPLGSCQTGAAGTATQAEERMVSRKGRMPDG